MQKLCFLGDPFFQIKLEDCAFVSGTDSVSKLGPTVVLLQCENESKFGQETRALWQIRRERETDALVVFREVEKVKRRKEIHSEGDQTIFVGSWALRVVGQYKHMAFFVAASQGLTMVPGDAPGG